MQAKAYTTGSKVPRLELIPRAAMLSLSARFEAGIIIHQEKAWNALSANQEALEDRDMLIARLGHGADHISKAIAILTGEIPDDGDDHAGAIMWAGAFLASANARRKNLPSE